MSSDTPTSIKPPADLETDTFPLKENHMFLLQKYVYSGVQLPITVEDYTKQFVLAQATVAKFSANVNGIVTVYTACQAHTSNYKNNIHPTTVSLASDLVNYSNTAATYYAAIYQAIQDLDASKSPPLSDDEVQKRKARVGALVDDQVVTMSAMVTKAEKIVADLAQFETETSADETSLVRENSSLAGKLDDTSGEIAGLEKQISDLQKAIDTAQKAYEDTLDKISDIPKWGWIPYVGWIAAAIKGSEWTKAAKTLANQMNTDKTSMDAVKAELESCKNMKIQGTTMASDLKRMIDLIGPAKTTIQLMQGAFGAISTDLTTVKDKVDKGVRDAKAIIADVQIDDVLNAWKSLGHRGDQYRQVAYVSMEDGMTDPTF